MIGSGVGEPGGRIFSYVVDWSSKGGKRSEGKAPMQPPGWKRKDRGQKRGVLGQVLLANRPST